MNYNKRPVKHYFKQASLDGLGVTINANADYSVTPGSFRIAPSVTEYVDIYRMIAGIKDLNINNSDEYGAIAALTNGVVITVKDSGDNIVDTITPSDTSICTNGDWATQCYDTTIFSLGNGEDYVTARWTFSKSGAPLTLKGPEGTYIEILLNDDLTGLTKHIFTFQGIYLIESY